MTSGMFLNCGWVCLVSIKALKNGINLSNKGLLIFLSKESASVTFDRVIRTTNGSVSGIIQSVNESPVVYNIIRCLFSEHKIIRSEFHKMLGHYCSDRMQKTANVHGLKLDWEFKTCEYCFVTKAKQKNVNKEWKDRSQVPGEQFYLDVISNKDLWI